MDIATSRRLSRRCMAAVVIAASVLVLTGRAITTARADEWISSGSQNIQPTNTVYFLYCEAENACENEYFDIGGNDTVSYAVDYSDQYQSYYLDLTRADMDTYVKGGENNNSATQCFAEKQEQEWEWSHHPRYNGDPQHYQLAAQYGIDHPTGGYSNPGDSVQAGYTILGDFYWDPTVQTDIGCRSPDSGGGQEFWYGVVSADFGN